MTKQILLKAASPGSAHAMDILFVDFDHVRSDDPDKRYEEDAEKLWDALKAHLPGATMTALMKLVKPRVREGVFKGVSETLTIKEGDVVTLSGARVPAAAVAEMQETLSRAMGFEVPVLVVPDGKLGTMRADAHVCEPAEPEKGVVVPTTPTLMGIPIKEVDRLDSWVDDVERVAGKAFDVPEGKVPDWQLLQDPSRWPMVGACCVKHTMRAVPSPARAVDFAGTVKPAEEIDAGPPRFGTVWLPWSFTGGQFRISKKAWNNRTPPPSELDTYPHWCYTSIADALADGWMID